VLQVTCNGLQRDPNRPLKQLPRPLGRLFFKFLEVLRGVANKSIGIDPIDLANRWGNCFSDR